MSGLDSIVGSVVSKFNKPSELMAYFSAGGRKVTITEYRVFWDEACSDEDKVYFKTVNLETGLPA